MIPQENVTIGTIVEHDRVPGPKMITHVWKDDRGPMLKLNGEYLQTWYVPSFVLEHHVLTPSFFG